MLEFAYTALPSRVVFGRGSLSRVADELATLNITRAFLLATPEQESDVRALASRLEDRAVGVFAGARMHTPVEVTEQAMSVLSENGADGLVSFGGGSTIGLGKAIALRTDLPHLAIPTTYAGSEMTPILGQTEGGVKTTLRSEKVLPETVIYDPDLTLTLPVAIAAPSAMNAIAHSVEALYARDGNPIHAALAEQSIRALATAIPAMIDDPADAEARAGAFYGSWLAGSCLAAVGMALHHKICHTLGGTFDLNHAAIHCLMIPYSLAYNRAHIPEAMTALNRALDGRDPVDTLFDLMQRSNRQKSLADFSLTAADVDKAVTLAMANPYWNPRPVTADGLRDMLMQALAGRRPA
jgi:maleylacetate reductase